MVCLGNICRSPLAEGLLASKLPENKFIVDSAGTGNWHIGKQPDARAIAVGRLNGLDIASQRGRQFTAKDFDDFDYIFVMDNSNHKDVMALAKTDVQRSKVNLILHALFPNENVDVPDPYFGMKNGFETVYALLDDTCKTIAKSLIEKHS